MTFEAYFLNLLSQHVAFANKDQPVIWSELYEMVREAYNAARDDDYNNMMGEDL